MIVKEDLSRVFANLRRTQSFLLGTDRITSNSGNSADHSNMVLALTLWFGILSDYSNFATCACESNETRAHKAMSTAGRVASCLRHTEDFKGRDVVMTPFFDALDDLADIQLWMAGMCSDFKDPSLRVFIEAVVAWKAGLRRRFKNAGEDREEEACLPFQTLVGALQQAGELVILTFSNEVVQDGRCINSMTWLRQISCFLKKVAVERKSLADECMTDTLRADVDLELFVYAASSYHAVEGPAARATALWQRNTEDMRQVLVESGLADTWATVTGFVPCHGQGVVSEKSIKTWYEKYQKMRPDPRVAYLLRHSDLGQQSDFNPLIREESEAISSRTSRFIAVPKNWKKMRGISAEPAELQFWQQGVMHSMDRALRRNIFWRQRVNIHDQTRSQYLALAGSKTGEYATIDLSGASDSVSVRLVHDVFGNTELCRWLLGTRSVQTEFDGFRRELTKFAPMGSATCFPVESIIFALVAEVAVRRTRSASCKRKGVRAYGDDIILPTYAFKEAIDILESLGFTVNWDKSFHTGGFRESCGAEGWVGTDIRPIRFKSIPIPGFRACLTPDITAAAVTMINALWERGYLVTRGFLAQLLFSTTFRFGSGGGKKKTLVTYPSSLASFFTFTGEHSTVSSPCPTNFHLRRKYDSRLQTIVFEVLVWRKRAMVLSSIESNLEEVDACRLVEWLVRHGENRADTDQPIPYQCMLHPEQSTALPVTQPVFESEWQWNPTLVQVMAKFRDRRDGAGSDFDGLTNGVLEIIARCGLSILRSEIQSYKDMDDRYHLCFSKNNQSFANMGALGRYSAPIKMVPTVKWVSREWLDADALPVIRSSDTQE